MQTISQNELESVTGGSWGFLGGYAASKGLDGLIEIFGNYVEEFAVNDHSMSNRYFEENSEQFNPLL